ncbi:MAG: DUF547 domain-containing protein, partial [Candidatus Zophobacter franzmannii]|nr:DUF547 domain-containing protein [Candidatus Zophobacter franzmannii]
MDMIFRNHQAITLTTDEMDFEVDRKAQKCGFDNSSFPERNWPPRRHVPFSFFTTTVLLMCLLTVVTPAMAREFDHTHTVYDGIAQQCVQKGQVNYRGIRANLTPLNLYLAQLERVSEKDFDLWKETQQIAYLSNLYNASTIKLIQDHYPVKSIKDIGSFFKGPWDQPAVRLFGKAITLNTLEHRILRVKYAEPRLHMALVCAAKGCPPLRSEAYTAEKLSAQLNDQAKQFLSNPIKFRIDRRNRKVYISPIFKWYGEDFVKKFTPKAGFRGLGKTMQAVLNFCSQYLSDADQKYLAAGDYSVKYLPYDWT